MKRVTATTLAVMAISLVFASTANADDTDTLFEQRLEAADFPPDIASHPYVGIGHQVCIWKKGAYSQQQIVGMLQPPSPARTDAQAIQFINIADSTYCP